MKTEQEKLEYAFEQVKGSESAILELLNLTIGTDYIHLDDLGNPYCALSGNSLIEGVKLVFED